MFLEQETGVSDVWRWFWSLLVNWNGLHGNVCKATVGHKLAYTDIPDRYRMHVKQHQRETVGNGGACGKPRAEMAQPKSSNSYFKERQKEFLKPLHKQNKRHLRVGLDLWQVICERAVRLCRAVLCGNTELCWEDRTEGWKVLWS